MPATLNASHSLVGVSPAVTSGCLSAPLSRTDDAEVISSSCMACGREIGGWGWVNRVGTGVLMHHTTEGSVPCPTAAPFDWVTGDTLPVPAAGVTA
ncbi:hypothetical protein [Streptomyces apocyni]|uniref:hypothetical protein n=1 Tax=Streptomyces apocyni TaxID=2654677 RepID=UPI0012EAF697|nr:hypothetical protein [Streptomyces apocyni]